MVKQRKKEKHRKKLIIIQYFKYEVNTQIYLINETLIEFPSIAFCFRNSFKLNENGPKAFFHEGENTVLEPKIRQITLLTIVFLNSMMQSFFKFFLNR